MITSKIKVMGLLGLPLLAIAIAVMLFAFNPATDTRTVEADVDGAAMTLSIGGETGKVEATRGTGFKVSVSASAIPPCSGAAEPLPGDHPDQPGKIACVAPNTGGYLLAQAWINFGATGLTFKTSSTTWPNCNAVNVGSSDAENASRGCLTGVIPVEQFGSLHKGEIFSFTLNCPDAKGTHTITLEPTGGPNAGTSGAQYTEFGGSALIVPEDSITVNCVNPPTATPTATPPPIPKMSKCDQTDNFGSDPDNGPDGIKDAGPCGSLVNHFLQRQGAKIPPADCLGGTPTELAEKLSQGIVSQDPKGAPGDFQQLAAFEFEVHYDNKKVCIDLTQGGEFDLPVGVCLIEDDAPDSKPQLEGVARIGCVTVGKENGIDNLAPLASIDVYPQPEIYSQAKPNQDNGVVVQINNVNCDLGDEQGHAIPIFSCDDVDITFRYLEGDVDPNCVIDASDAQAIAFRWGVEKGSLIYKDFMNLEPSSQQQDNDIDINDLQFVFGRLGSTCKEPHPDQPAVNPKA